MKKDFPSVLYHGSKSEITDGVIHAHPAHRNHMKTPVTAVFATANLTHAKLYAIMRLVGEGWLSPRGQGTLYVEKIKLDFPSRAFVYELDSDGFERDVDGSYYCLSDRPIKNIIEIDIKKEIRNGNLKIYVLKDKKMPQPTADGWRELLQNPDNFELYNTDSENLETAMYQKHITNQK